MEEFIEKNLSRLTGVIVIIRVFDAHIFGRHSTCNIGSGIIHPHKRYVGHPTIFWNKKSYHSYNQSNLN